MQRRPRQLLGSHRILAGGHSIIIELATCTSVTAICVVRFVANIASVAVLVVTVFIIVAIPFVISIIITLIFTAALFSVSWSMGSSFTTDSFASSA